MIERSFSVEEVAEAPAVPKAPPVGSGQPVGGRDYLDGFLSQLPARVAADAPGGEVYDAVIAALRDIFDPEIPVNIYDLGLIYGVEIDGGHVVVSMTLTTPHCPVAETMPGEVELRVMNVPRRRDRRGQPRLGSGVGPRQDERRGQARTGDAVMGAVVADRPLRRPRPAPVTVTPAAAARIADLIARAPEAAAGVRLTTPKRGCSGLALFADLRHRAEARRRGGGDAGRDAVHRRRLAALPDRQRDGLGRGRFRRRLHLQQSQRQGELRLRRELHGVIRASVAAALGAALLLSLGGCVTTVVGAAVDVVTAPVRIVGAGIDVVAPGQKERDRRRGKRARKAEEQARRDAKKAKRDTAQAS